MCLQVPYKDGSTSLQVILCHYSSAVALRNILMQSMQFRCNECPWLNYEA